MNVLARVYAVRFVDMGGPPVAEHLFVTAAMRSRGTNVYYYSSVPAVFDSLYRGIDDGI